VLIAFIVKQKIKKYIVRRVVSKKNHNPINLYYILLVISIVNFMRINDKTNKKIFEMD
jgi:hypothetical protein